MDKLTINEDTIYKKKIIRIKIR